MGQQTFDELELELKAKADVMTVDMQDLRDRANYGKLGRYVIEAIHDALASRGIGHTELTKRQWDTVRIWKQGTRVGRLIEAAQMPSDANDEELRELATSNADEVLQRVRALVGA